ncbi:MAG TPA: hypothetical protein VMH37_04420 [Candidatus Binataceae bacterium]|nr:hypothetical protein [Candidatus Binataceae bacterium]
MRQQFFVQAFTNRDADCHGNADTDGDIVSNCHPDRHGDRDAHGDRNSVGIEFAARGGQ